MSTTFYDPRSERRVAAAVAEEHRAAAAERRAAAEAAREAARVENAARALELAENAKARTAARKADRRAARAVVRRARFTAWRAGLAAALPGWGMSGLWASVIIAPLALTWTAQTVFAVEQLSIPAGMAWLFPLAVETGAWVCAFESHRRTRAGRPVGSLPAWMWLLAGVAAAINFAHGLSSHGVAAGLALGALSVLGVLLHHVRQTLDRAHVHPGGAAAVVAGLRVRAARWVWHPVLSLRACSIAARAGTTTAQAWEAAHLDRYGVGSDASRRDRRLGRVIARRQWQADRDAARKGGFLIVGGIILALPHDGPTEPAPAAIPAASAASEVAGTAAVRQEQGRDVAESKGDPAVVLSPRAADLLARTRDAIAAGQLPPRPSAHAIRKQFGGSSETATAVRNTLAQHATAREEEAAR